MNVMEIPAYILGRFQGLHVVARLFRDSWSEFKDCLQGCKSSMRVLHICGYIPETYMYVYITSITANLYNSVCVCVSYCVGGSWA